MLIITYIYIYTVYIYTHPKDSIRLKLCIPEISRNSLSVARPLQNLQALRRLVGHPNIIKLHEVQISVFTISLHVEL